MGTPPGNATPMLRTVQPTLPGLLVPTLRGRPPHPQRVKRVAEYLVRTLGFTANQVAECLPVKPWTIHHWSSEGKWRKPNRGPLRG